MSTSDLPVWSDLTRDERLAIVKPLWLDEGKSAGDISMRFSGATRSAVIGLVHRAKLGRAEKRALPNPRKAKVPQVRQQRAAVKPALAPRKTGPQVEPPPARDSTVLDHVHQNRPPLPDCAPVTLLNLPNREKGVCRFPVVGGYCGQLCDDNMSVCLGHEGYFYAPEALERIRKKRAVNARG